MLLHSLCLFVNFWRFLCLYTHELYYFCKKIPMNDTNLLNKSADNIRVLTAAMVEKAKSGPPEVLWGELILSMCYIPSF